MTFQSVSVQNSPIFLFYFFYTFTPYALNNNCTLMGPPLTLNNCLNGLNASDNCESHNPKTKHKRKTTQKSIFPKDHPKFPARSFHVPSLHFWRENFGNPLQSNSKPPAMSELTKSPKSTAMLVLCAIC